MCIDVASRHVLVRSHHPVNARPQSGTATRAVARLCDGTSLASSRNMLNLTHNADDTYTLTITRGDLTRRITGSLGFIAQQEPEAIARYFHP